MYSILLVDDEKLELETLRDYIDWDSMEFDRVYTSRSGSDAYDKVQRLKPDVMITDIHMPVMSGIDLARQMYEDGCKTKIVFLSGYDEFEYAKAALQVNAADYILKPFNEEKIRNAMNRVKEMIHKENLLNISVKVLERSLIRQMIEYGGIRRDEVCRQFMEIHETGEHEFGLMQVAGSLNENILERVVNNLSEVVFAVSGGVKEYSYFLVRYFVDFKEAAQRIRDRLMENGVERAILYLNEKVPIRELHEQAADMAQLSDRMFYVSSDKVISREELKAQVELLEKEAENWDEHTHVQAEINRLFSVRNMLNKKSIQQFTDDYFEKLMQHPRISFYILDELHYFISRVEEIAPVRGESAEEGQHSVSKEIYKAVNLDEVRDFVQEQVLDQLPKQDEESKEEVSRNRYVVNSVKHYVETHFADVINVDEIADEIGLSPNYVRSIFKESEGTTLNDWITEYRLNRACELLMERKLRIKEISQKVGYESSSYFCSVFAKKYGISPNEYRLKLLEEN